MRLLGTLPLRDTIKGLLTPSHLISLPNILKFIRSLWRRVAIRMILLGLDIVCPLDGVLGGIWHNAESIVVLGLSDLLGGG